MKVTKKSKGWILEELERKNECLDADDFGGENPEDVEKQRVEKDKEINKRFTDTRKNSEKVKGEDFVVEEYFTDRKELSKYVEDLKGHNIKPIISRSTKEGYRWCVSCHILRESRGRGFVTKYRGHSIIDVGDRYVITNEHGLNVGETKFGLPVAKGMIDDLVDNRVDESFEKTIIDNLVAFGICDNEEEARERVSRMNDDQKRNWLNSFGRMAKNLLVDEDVDTLAKKLGKKLLPPEDWHSNKGKGKFEIYWFNTEDCQGDPIFKVFNSKKAAEKWVENHKDDADKFNMSDVEPIFEQVEDEELLTLSEAPSKRSQTDSEGHAIDDENFVAYDDLCHLVYRVLSGVIDAFNYKGQEVRFKDLDGATEFALLHLPDEYEFRDDVDESLNEDKLPDVIPEEPIVVSTEVPEEEMPVVEEPTETIVDNGIYLALSSELRDTLQDIENLKGLTVTLASEENREDIIDELNTIIDDRTIHSGLLQGLMEKVDTKIETEEPKEEKVFDESLMEALGSVAERLASWSIEDFKNYNDKYNRGDFAGSEASPYNLDAIQKWIDIRDEYKYVDEPDEGDWQAIDIKKYHSKYETNYIFIDPERKLWRIRTTGDEFYHGPHKLYK